MAKLKLTTGAVLVTYGVGLLHQAIAEAGEDKVPHVPITLVATTSAASDLTSIYTVVAQDQNTGDEKGGMAREVRPRTHFEPNRPFGG